MKKGYYITEAGEKVILKSQEIIDVSYKKIVELVIPEGVKWVSCYNNQLTELNLPEGIKFVHCNYIPNLKTPNGCKVNMEI